MNILLVEQYSKFTQDVIQYADDLLREVVSDDNVRQEIKHEWYPDEDNTDWNDLLKAEAASYSFDSSIYPDNFLNE